MKMLQTSTSYSSGSGIYWKNNTKKLHLNHRHSSMHLCRRFHS